MSDGIRRILFSGGRGRESAAHILSLAKAMAGKDCRVLIERQTAAVAGLSPPHLPPFAALAADRDIPRAEMAAVFGGDGAFIAAARRLAPRGLPLFGINLGTLGFLTDLSPRNMRAGARRILSGKFREEVRMMLRVAVPQGKKSASARDEIAVNDLVISRGHGGRLVALSVFISGQFAFALRADGLILSTPTGSTAYNLAAGGPIVEPEMDAFSLAPLCPHALAHRPLLVGGQREIAVRVDAAQEAFLHIDGQVDFSLRPGDLIVARRHPKRLLVRHPPGHDYFETLRRKLRWGEHADPTPPARLRPD